MTAAETLAALLLLPILFACLWRARLLALAILPPLGLALAQWLELVDTSSAGHPLRWIVPVLCASLAGLAGVLTARQCRARFENRRRRLDAAFNPAIQGRTRESCVRVAARHGSGRFARTIVASLLVLGSCAPDLLALHPFFWARFAEWPLVPLQISVCATILAVLLAPERWVRRWIPT